MFKICLVGGPRDGGTMMIQKMYPYLDFPIAFETPALMGPVDEIIDTTFRIVRYKRSLHGQVYYYVD